MSDLEGDSGTNGDDAVSDETMRLLQPLASIIQRWICDGRVPSVITGGLLLSAETVSAAMRKLNDRRMEPPSDEPGTGTGGGTPPSR